MHYEILDQERKELLPSLHFLKERFYLAGGTSLALQLGHRDSIDFDFFTPQNFDTYTLFQECERNIPGKLIKIQDENNTLTFLVDGRISVSLLGYPYAMVEKLIDSEHVSLASVVDIGCMKLSAITSRSTLKDYVDLYFILKIIRLKELIQHTKVKLPLLDTTLILKSLSYFDDIHREPILFMPGHEVSIEKIKNFLSAEVKALIA